MVNQRSFQKEWLTKYAWLKYEDGEMYCSVCKAFEKKNTLTSGSNFRTSTLVRHIESRDHRESVIARQDGNDDKEIFSFFRNCPSNFSNVPPNVDEWDRMSPLYPDLDRSLQYHQHMPVCSCDLLVLWPNTMAEKKKVQSGKYISLQASTKEAFDVRPRVHTRGSTSNLRTFEGFFENISMIKCQR